MSADEGEDALVSSGSDRLAELGDLCVADIEAVFVLNVPSNTVNTCFDFMWGGINTYFLIWGRETPERASSG